MKVATIGLSCIALAACVEVGPPGPVGSPDAAVEIRVGALNLEGVGEVVWDLEVDNGRDEVVWQRRITSSGYGDGAGSAAYVGPCDADPAADENTVKVWVVGAYAAPVSTANAGSFAAGDDSAVVGTPVAFQNPTSVAALSQDVVCAANSDIAVRFDVALMRPALQGFFDIAVTFDDIYCSAKLDCCQDSDDDGCSADEEIDLLFDPDGDRARTFVLGFACTAGVAADVETTLWLDPLVLDCDVNSDGATVAADVTINPAAASGPGNLCESGAMSGCAAITEADGADADTWLYQVAAYRGVERLTSGGVDAQKLYWNVALGVKAAISACTLHTTGTAEDAADPDDLIDGGVVAAGAVYPFIIWSVPLDATCGSEALTFGVPGASVTTGYTATGDDATTFAYGFAPALPVAGVEARATSGETSFVVPAGVSALTAKLWGGGGGGAGAYNVGAIQGLNGHGGAGGFASCTMAVSPGETLTVRVGGGGLNDGYSGSANGTGGYNGGAPGYNTHSASWGGSGPGGGASEVLRGTTQLCVAGGGGGGGYSYPTEVIGTGYGRGGGGGQRGEIGRGHNGTDTLGGGAGGESGKSGSQGTVTSNLYGGGGGGGGYRGGTGGTAGDGSNGGIGCGGGGGTSYAPGGAVIDAVYEAVPNTTDGDYVSGAAAGGAASQSAPASGGDGLVVLRWGI
jgi:hypothetical protein